MTYALAGTLGWDKNVAPDDATVFVIAASSVGDIAAHVERRLDVRAIRVIGRPRMRVTRVGFLPGMPPASINASALFRKVDLIIAGEQREWEGVYYAFDAVTAGLSKAMITIGHAISEDPGMKLCAEWLSTFIQDVPVAWIAAGEPFTRP